MAEYLTDFDKIDEKTAVTTHRTKLKRETWVSYYKKSRFFMFVFPFPSVFGHVKYLESQKVLLLIRLVSSLCFNSVTL